MNSFLSGVKALFFGFGIIGVLAFWTVCVALFVGWWINLYKLGVMVVHLEPVTQVLVLILRIVGVPIGPLGGIMGLFV